MNRIVLVFSVFLFFGAKVAFAQTIDIDSLLSTPASIEDGDDFLDLEEDIDDVFNGVEEVEDAQDSPLPPMVIKNISKGDSDYFQNNLSPKIVSPTNTPIQLKSPVNNINAPNPEAASAKINKDVSLTGIFEEKAAIEKADNVKDESAKAETWLDKLRSSAESDLKDESKDKKEKSENASDGKDSSSLKSMVEDSKKGSRRSNVAVFDISGAMLRMNPAQIDEVLTRRGYKKTNEKFEIPNFIKWRKEDECRASGVIGYERLASCVVKTSKDENYQYVETVSYAKFDSQENIEVKFSSNFTSNKAYKIRYSSSASNVTGNSQKAIYMRNVKVYDFWKQINHKYGAPDNKEDVIWGLGGNRPYMQASTGKLMIEDPMLRELDYTRMSREDQKFMNTGTFNF